nr:MAG TPA: hypothetical protein [Caudoviricetes sp.]
MATSSSLRSSRKRPKNDRKRTKNEQKTNKNGVRNAAFCPTLIAHQRHTNRGAVFLRGVGVR